MLPKQSKFAVRVSSLLFKGAGLSTAAAISLGGSGAVFAQSTVRDVIVDTGAPVTQPGSPTSVTTPTSGTRFSCQFVNGQYSVMYYPESQPGQSYAWATPGAMGGGWSPERRCNEITRRLESYRPDGLQEMRTGVENGYNVVCVTTQRFPSCRIVLTVPHGQDPQITRDRVFQNLTVADSGQATQGVTTFMGGDDVTQILNDLLNVGLPSGGTRNVPRSTSQNINLRPFLDRADGGTATRLTGGMRSNSAPRLNPDRFR